VLLWSLCCSVCEIAVLVSVHLTGHELLTRRTCSAARIRRFGLRGMRTDDALMVFCLATFTVMTVGINQLLARGGKVAYIPERMLARLPQQEIERLMGNAKWMYVNSHMLSLTMWSAKFCMVILYLRIT